MAKFFKQLLSDNKELVFVAVLGLITFLIFVPVFTYMYFARDLESKETIMNRNDTGLLLLDRTGKPFFSFYEAKEKNEVPLSDIPLNLQNALIATEDKEFYSHPGFSIRGIARSILLDLQLGDTAYGGSTITQQLVKNALLNSKRSFLRKYQEVVLAQEIERRYTKKEILEMYLNSVYFGEGAFGVENAAESYFGIPAKDLSLSQSAMLIGLLPAPSRYSPLTGDEKLAKNRQEKVLDNMVSQGYITSEQKDKALIEKLAYSPLDDNLNSAAPHFALMVKDVLEKQFGEETISRSGFRVRTSLDLELQEYAETTVENNVNSLAGNQVSNGAAIVIDPKTGEILTLVGSKDWSNTEFGKVNIVTSLRQPGSSFKPIIYSAALEDGIITPATVLPDVPTTFPGNYKPLDYDKQFRGQVLARRALANSLNIPAVEVMRRVGVERGLDIASSLGITTLKNPSNYGLSLVLGTGEVKLLELTNAYATFANHGIYTTPTTILSIEDKRGENIYTHTPEQKQVISPQAAFLVSSILSDNRARAEVFGNSLTISRTAAVKTGTTEDYKDALTLGYTPQIAVGVWVGNNDGTPMDRIAGSLGAAPIWRSLMEHFLSGKPEEKFFTPDGISEKNICSSNGLLVRNATSSARLEYFLSGTEPTKFCDSGNTQGDSSTQPSQPPDPTSESGQQSPTESPKEEKNRGNNGNGNGNGNNNVNLEIDLP